MRCFIERCNYSGPALASCYDLNDDRAPGMFRYQECLARDGQHVQTSRINPEIFWKDHVKVVEMPAN